MHFLKYVKRAFLYHWNLLLFGGGMAAALLSPVAPEALASLVLAGEVAYLGLLSANHRFRQYVDAQEAKAGRAGDQISVEQTMGRILSALPKGLVQRFESLRTRCMELRQLAQEMRDPNRLGDPLPLEALQLAGLDRLLWIQLRLLFTQHSLERFLDKTPPKQIQGEIRDLEARLKAIPAETPDVQQQRVRKALEDNVETSRGRLANCQKARDNYELVKVEIDRLENKIRSLSELAVNRHEPDFIAGQVDQVVGGMVQTERTMSELQFATGLGPIEDEVPEMLRRAPVATRGS